MMRCVLLVMLLSIIVDAIPTLPSSTYDHVGVVVNDTVAVRDAWVSLLGISTPSTFNNAGPAANLTFHGVHTDANILGAYFDCVKVEVLQPTGSPRSFWKDHLELFGNSPFYLGFATDQWQIPDLDRFTQEFTAVGCPTSQKGYWMNTPTTRGCYHYMHCEDSVFGANIEVMTRNNCTMSSQYSTAADPAVTAPTNIKKNRTN